MKNEFRINCFLTFYLILQISYASTSTALSDKKRYEFFARTVPPDKYQARALVDFIEHFNWTYVSLISSEGQYGESGSSAFRTHARMRNICFAIQEKVVQSANDTEYDRIIESLKRKSTARAVVLFLRMEDAKGLLKAAKRANVTNSFTWVAADGWGKEMKVVQGVEDVALGAITVELSSTVIREFDDYLLKLNVKNNRRNPWFKEFWQETFKCDLAPRSLLTSMSSYKARETDNEYTACSPHLSLRDVTDYRQESKVQFVIDAVYAFAHAIHNAWLTLCSGKGTICPELRELDPEVFYKHYLLNVAFTEINGNNLDGSLVNFSFILNSSFLSVSCRHHHYSKSVISMRKLEINIQSRDLEGSEVRFDECGDGLGRYNIFNFQSLDSNSSTYGYVRVGQWRDNELNIKENTIIWDSFSSQEIPTSVCSEPCKVGEIKKGGDLSCCWICQECKPWEIAVNETSCVPCDVGMWPFPNKSSCFELPLKYIRWYQPYAFIPMSIAIIGIITVLYHFTIFIQHVNTPIVKASGRELCYVLLAGIASCYVMAFIILTKPTYATCLIQRLGIGVCISMIYGAILTKTNRISRIFHSARRSARRPTYISPVSQLCITGIIVFIQICLNILWCIVEVPGVRHEVSEKRDVVVLKCAVTKNSVLVSLIYGFVLVATSTYYAFKTRKIPENFNETKFIVFTMYATCIIWIAFLAIYLSTENNFEIQLTTLAMSLTLSGYVCLICLFSPKIYIILRHPDKNVRKLTMNSGTYKKGPSGSGYPQETPPPYSPGPSNSAPNRSLPPTSYGACNDQPSFSSSGGVVKNRGKGKKKRSSLTGLDDKGILIKDDSQALPLTEIKRDNGKPNGDDEDAASDEEEDEEEDAKDDSSAVL
uniref:G-protein coupled receptors family 3 profile domain-containing protein n=1 Tax=Tetranychus urticae TaxID=32264 RepID=T1L4Q2_TETUR